MKNKITLLHVVLAATLLLIVDSYTAFSQCIDCGTGVDGAYLATTNTSIVGGTYNFSSFTINAGVTVNVTGNSPLIIYSTGNVDIQGTLTASGGNGTNGVTFSTYGIGGVGVAGGANGGDGVFIGFPSPGVDGSGTGSGTGGGGWSGGGGAGYASAGASSGSTSGGFGGIAYGTIQIASFDAGSGGGGGSGGNNCGSGGGGAGGGLIQISTCGTMTIDPGAAILCDGGNGGSDGFGNCGGGGGGSGGSIWLIANTIVNNGNISAVGGAGGSSTNVGAPYWGVGGVGSEGRVRMDYFFINGTGTINPAIGFTAQPSNLSAATTVVDATCAGLCTGTLSINVLNGTPPYTYLWSTGCTNSTCNNVCAGIYTVTVNDFNGCTFYATDTVSEPPAILVNALPVPATCANECVTLHATASAGNGGPFTFAWSPSVTDSVACPTSPTTYTVVVTDNLGCTATSTTSVNVLSLPVLSLSAQYDTTCVYSTIDILFCSPSGGHYFGTGVNGNNFNATIAGLGMHTVYYRYTDNVISGGNGCSDTVSISIYVDACTGVEQADGNAGITISPNPVTAQLTVGSLQLAKRIEIYDVLGERIYSLPENLRKGTSSTSIDVSSFTPGIYFLKLSTENGNVVRKFVKQ